jgi:hypothetical protein
MTLTWRPLRIGPPIYAHLADDEALEDGHSIGRTMEERQDREVKRPEQAWSWSLTIIGARMAGIKTSGYGRDLNDAKWAFQAALNANKAWREDSEFAPGSPLTLRPTGLSRDPNANDWCVYEDGEDIGRIYETTSAPTEEHASIAAHATREFRTTCRNPYNRSPCPLRCSTLRPSNHPMRDS